MGDALRKGFVGPSPSLEDGPDDEGHGGKGDRVRGEVEVEWTRVICLIIDNRTHVLYPTMLIPVKRRFSADDSFRSVNSNCQGKEMITKCMAMGEILSARSKTSSSQDNYV